MYNVIKMDLYSIIRMKFIWIMMIIVIALSTFSVVMTNVDIKGMIKNELQKEDIGVVIEDESVSMCFGIAAQTKSEWITSSIKYSDFLEVQLASGIFILLLAIFVPIYVYSDKEHGFIKNIVGQVKCRWYLVISKLVGIAVINIILFVTILIGMFVVGKIVLGEQFIFGSVFNVIKVVLGQYILHLGFSTFIMMLTIVFNSKDISIAIGLVMCIKVFTVIYVGLDKCFEQLNIGKLDFAKYAIEMNVCEFSIYNKSEDIAWQMFIGIMSIAIGTLISIKVFQNRDIV